MQTDRKKFIKELKEERQLRNLIQRGLKVIYERKQKQKLLNEQKLRIIIRGLISEATSGAIAIHDNTGMNRLEYLVQNTAFLETLKTHYKSLASSAEQRASFRDHIMNAVSALLARKKLNSEPDQNPSSDSEESMLKATPEQLNEDQMDVEFDSELSPEEKERSEFSISGLDTTGRNVALDAFKSVKPHIENAIGPLDAPEDFNYFSEYILKNMNVFFSEWEEEVTNKPISAHNEQPTPGELEG